MNLKLSTALLFTLLSVMANGSRADAATVIYVAPQSHVIAGTAGIFSESASFDRTYNGNGLDNAALVATGAPVLASTSIGPKHTNAFDVNTGRFISSTNLADTNGQGDSTTGTLTMTFNLGAAYDLTGLWFWNYLEGSGGTADRRNRGLDSVYVEFSTDNVNWTNGQTITPALANTDGSAQQILFTGTNTGVQYVRFSQLSNFGPVASDAGPGQNNYIGFSEIRFLAAVPEPSHSLLGTLGFMALTLRRRRPLL
jgi:hypothetical protein